VQHGPQGHTDRQRPSGTDIRLAMTAAMRRSLAEDRSEFDPRKVLRAATAAARQICKARFEAFGTAGQASRIKPIALEKLAERYAKGELKQVITGVLAAA
jgi:fructose-bisphosphate aldolase class II